jgi:cell fate (sporulation/competence/biofilm development) regulator YmcA (YheA/YmcA/DUF963 family)
MSFLDNHPKEHRKMTTEERIDALEEKVDALIENLRLNNNDLNDVLGVLATESNPGDRASAVTDYVTTVCTRIPPGC